MSDKSKILIAAVMYSPNLGDGIIADCIKSVLGNELDIEYLDLSGRLNFLESGRIANRGLIFRIIDRLPENFRDYILSFIITSYVKVNFIQKWRESIKRSDAVLLGGGQLLSSGHMNFPNKLQIFLRECDRQNKPVAIYSVGVGGRWSHLAEKKFLDALSRKCVTSISVRDQKSIDVLIALKSRSKLKFKDPSLTLDPGILSSSAYGINKIIDHDRTLIGFNIISPGVLETVSNNLGFKFDRNLYSSNIKKLIIRLCEYADSVSLYTNGAFEDEEFKDYLYNKMTSEVSNLKCIGRPNRPEELAAIISKFNLNIAHRLHSNIVAYSMGIPILGLTWSEKVESFFKGVGLEKYYFNGLDLNVEAVLSGVKTARADQCSSATRISLQEKCHAEIKRLAEGFSV